MPDARHACDYKDCPGLTEDVLSQGVKGSSGRRCDGQRTAQDAEGEPGRRCIVGQRAINAAMTGACMELARFDGFVRIKRQVVGRVGSCLWAKGD